MSMNSVLIIDDRQSEVWFIERVLQKMGLSVMAAGDGEEGLKIISESMPQLIILDTIMPRMDGYTFYQRLISNQGTAKIPVLLLSDKDETYEKSRLFPPKKNVLSSSRSRPQECSRANLEYIFKPINPEELERKANYLLQNPVQEIASPCSNRRPHVLIIDDDVQLTNKCITALQQIGVDAAAAAGGLVGLGKVKEYSPDLIVLDTILPELNGLQVLQYIKQHYSIPVMMIPGKSEADLLNKALIHGADSYLIKPFEAASLVTFIQKKLEKMRKLQAAC